MCHQSRNHGDSPTISYSSVIVSNDIPSSWKIPSLKRKHTMNDQEHFNCIRQCERQLEKESICNDVRFVFTTICFVDSSFIFMLVVFIFVYWCPTRFPYQIMFVSLTVTRRVPLVEQELLTLPEHPSSPPDSWARFAHSLAFYIVFWK